jgi:hypothetical protein
MPHPFMAIPVVSLKRKVLEVSLEKHEPLLSPKLCQVCVGGEPFKSTGPASTTDTWRGADELA